MSSPANPEPPFALNAGLPNAPAETTRDPFEALDDLMMVVEALCPTWPERGTFADSSGFLL